MTACRCAVQRSAVRLNPFRVYARPSADQHGHRLLITMPRRVMEERFAIGAALHNRVDLNTTTRMSCCRPPPQEFKWTVRCRVHGRCRDRPQELRFGLA